MRKIENRSKINSGTTKGNIKVMNWVKVQVILIEEKNRNF